MHVVSQTAQLQPASCVFAELLNIGVICGKNSMMLVFPSVAAARVFCGFF